MYFVVTFICTMKQKCVRFSGSDYSFKNWCQMRLLKSSLTGIDPRVIVYKADTIPLTTLSILSL